MFYVEYVNEFSLCPAIDIVAISMCVYTVQCTHCILHSAEAQLTSILNELMQVEWRSRRRKKNKQREY